MSAAATRGLITVLLGHSLIAAAYPHAGSALANHLQPRLEHLAETARPGVLGVVVLDLASGAEAQVNGRRAFPMMSVFKVPLAATVLARMDRRELSLDRSVTLTRLDLRSGRSAIAAHFRGPRETFTVRELLAAAVSQSDNTAADALLRLVGGPHAVTAYLRQHGIRDMRVDRGEGEIADDLGLGDPSKRPRGETGSERVARLRRAYAAYLSDPRDRSTPQAAAQLLRALWQGELLSSASTRYLLDLMAAQTVPARLRAGLPSTVRLADKCGTSYTIAGRTAVYNDIGILIWPDGRAMIVAAFLTNSSASEHARANLFTALARMVVQSE